MNLAPEDENWMRVVDGACAECGFDASGIARPEVGGRLRSSAEGWRDLLAGSDAGLRPIANVWSPVEHGCHLRDLLVLFRHRLRRTLESPEPWYTKWDQDEAAVRERYAEQDPRRVAREIVVASERIAQDFDDLDDQAWARSGRRGDGVELTVEALGRYLLHELVHHAFDVERARHLARRAG